ncbi:MAG: hypothetical protein WC760_03765 [Bacteroidia bacterium]
MRLLLITVFLLIYMGVNSQTVVQQVHPNWYHTLLVGYEGVHQSGPNAHFNTVYKGRYNLEVGYGYDFLNSFTVTGKYYLNQGINQFYGGVGYGYFKLKQKRSYFFEINTAHFVLGYQSIIGRRFVINTEISIVKYLEQRFKLPNIVYSETYDWNEKIYFEVGIGIGYRFSLNQQLRKGNTLR